MLEIVEALQKAINTKLLTIDEAKKIFKDWLAREDFTKEKSE